MLHTMSIPWRGDVVYMSERCGGLREEGGSLDADGMARTRTMARHGTTVKWSSPSANACARRDWEGRAGRMDWRQKACGRKKARKRAQGRGDVHR